MEGELKPNNAESVRPGGVICLLTRYWWIWIISLSFLAYSPVINNFFLWDDFLWLYRAKTLFLNPGQIFKVDKFYFDPLIYLSFWADFKLVGLDFRWYHITDIIIHAMNGLLLFIFVKLYSRDEFVALFSSLIFVSTFAISDAVLWSSSRVDLFSTLFSLTTLIIFLKYIKNNNTFLYTVSIASYILALTAKGTPVVIPVLMLGLYIMEKKEHANRYIIFVPFIAITIGYLTLLHFATGGGGAVSKGLSKLNIYNYSLSLASLFVPELVLSKWNLTYTFIVVYLSLFSLSLVRFPQGGDRSKLLGLFMTFLFLVPILILGNLSLVSDGEPSYYLLTSPSHRIYMAAAGTSMFMSTILIRISNLVTDKAKSQTRHYVILCVLIAMVSFNCYETWNREKVWDFSSKSVKDDFQGLKTVKPALEEGGNVVLVNFLMSEAFLSPLIKVYYNVDDIIVSPLKFVPPIIPHSPVDPSVKYMLFAKTSAGVLDLSKPFNDILFKAFKYQNSNDLKEKEKYNEEYVAMVNNLNSQIKVDKQFQEQRAIYRK